MRQHFFVFLFIAGIATNGATQSKVFFSVMEDSIIHLHKDIISEHNPILRNQKNEHLLALLEETLEMKNSMSYPFDSVKTISTLTSPDKKIRVFTWYLTDNKGIHEHYGFLQTYNEEKRQYRLYQLVDKWQRINNPASQMLTCSNWYGSLYTELIEIVGTDKTYYTLLGWNGGDIFSQHKVIEILSINKNGIPSFGATIFKGYTKTRTLRIVFEYAKHSSFYLRYEKQFYTQKSDKRDKHTHKYSIDTIPSEMIIFNRLIPMDESLGEIPQFLVGETSLNDAFIEQNGKWVFKSNVIARNPDKSGSNSNKASKREVKARIFYSPEE
jgi:hypothetical protein